MPSEGYTPSPSPSPSASNLIEEYAVVAWDQIQVQDGTTRPMMYFVPSLRLLDTMRAEGMNTLPIEIRGTGVYDGTSFVRIEASKNVPKCRPNFFRKTHLYCAILLTRPFTLYPKHNGSFHVL